MGWLEIDNVSKMYKRRGTLLGGRDIEDDETVDEIDERDRDENRPLDDSGPDESRESWALRDVSLRIDPGDAVAVLGLGGSGKTTLIRLLAGLTLPTSGEVRGSGLIVPLNFLRTPFLTGSTGRQNLAMLESLLGMAKGRILDRAAEIAVFAGLERQLDQRVSEYSSSMYARLALAAGLFSEPGILLLDDAIGGSDRPFRAAITTKLEELVRQGATLVYASPTGSGLATTLCRRAVWLLDGRVIADGPASEILPRFEAVSTGEGKEFAEVQLAGTGNGDVVRNCGSEQTALVPRKVRLVPQESWITEVSNLEARWQRLLNRERATALQTQEPTTKFFRAELGSRATLTDIRVIDGEGRQVSHIPPGEPVNVEIEIHVAQENTEIGVRVEVDTRGALLFASDLPVPLCAKVPGNYLLSFPLEAWLTHQELEDVRPYKIRARTFFRGLAEAWQDMNIGTTQLHVSGGLRERFLLGDAADEIAPTAPLPIWLPTAGPSPSPELLQRKPLLRPVLNWRVYRLEETPDHESEPNGSKGDAESMDAL